MAKNFSIIAYLGLKSREFMNGLRGAQGATKTATGKMGAAFVKFGKLALLAVAAALAAIVVGIVKFVKAGVTEFAKFEKGMLEVFTLMPGISKKAMGKLSKDILNLSREMGILTDDMVPALYQAISAGVPKDNVIDFMRVASKTAIAGVTSLETAVDGLTSVINAYGKENMSVERAADIFFTTIKDGKTTFEELAASLYNVTPVAAALGVRFEDVAAAIAALTAQGVPTAQATTQIRSALLSLTAPSEKARGVAQMLGLDFDKLTQILKRPGGLKTAMEMVMKATGGNMDKMKALLGRIEGVNGILGLAQGNFASFTNAILSQSRAAGAHQRAFDTMNQGLSRSWDLLKAEVMAAVTEIGQAFAPMLAMIFPLIQKLAELFKKIDWSKMSDGVMKNAMAIKTALLPVYDALRVAWEDLMRVIGPVLEMFKKASDANKTKDRKWVILFAESLVLLVRLFEALITVLEPVIFALLASDNAAKKTGQSVEQTGGAVGGFVSKLIALVKWLTAITIKFTDFINSMGGPAMGKLFSFEYAWLKIKTTIMNVVAEIVEAVDGMIQSIVGFFVGLKDDAISTVSEWVNSIGESIVELWDSFANAFPQIASIITDAWNGITQVWDELVAFITDGVDQIWEAFETAFPGIAGIVKSVIDGIRAAFMAVFNSIKDKLGWLIKAYEKLTGKVLDINTEMTEKVAKIEQDALNERSARMQDFADSRKRREDKFAAERKRKAEEAAAAEAKIEKEKMAAMQRALLSLGVNRANVMKGTLKDLEKWLEAMGDAGQTALKKTSLENEAQISRMAAILKSLGHDQAALAKMTGEELRAEWLKTGAKGREYYAMMIAHEKKLAAAQLAAAEAGMAATDQQRANRQLTYAEMMAENAKRKAEAKARAKEEKAAAAEAAKQRQAAAKQAHAHAQARHQANQQRIKDWLSEGSHMFKIAGEWYRATNTADAQQKKAFVDRMRRMGKWNSATGTLIDMQGRMTQSVVTTGVAYSGVTNTRVQGAGQVAAAEGRVTQQQTFQAAKLGEQIKLDLLRAQYANAYANHLARAGWALKNSETRHQNAVIFTFHMQRYAAMYAANLAKARPELEALVKLFAGLPTGALTIDVGAAAFGTITPLLENMDKSLTSIDKTLKGKFVNQ